MGPWNSQVENNEGTYKKEKLMNEIQLSYEAVKKSHF